MDARTLVKILAALAVLVLLYRAWTMKVDHRRRMTNWNTNPYYGMDQEYAGQEYDMEEYDLETDLADTAEDLEDDYAVGDDDEDDYEDDDTVVPDSDLYAPDEEEDYEDDEDDYEDDEDDYEADEADTVVPDSDLYAPDEEDDYENGDYEEDYETSPMSAITRTNTPIMSPSSQLLPQPSVDAQDFAQYAPQNLEAQNFLTATQWIGVNTQGSSLRNANYDIRANPIIAKEDVGPWMQSTIDPDVYTNNLFAPISAM